ncbi:MAG: hypothetical protein FWE21_07525 [Defluviitaleaceae bacterium]|nr:hypothetical protein [Defluviitaleaceae bacterium]
MNDKKISQKIFTIFAVIVAMTLVFTAVTAFLIHIASDTFYPMLGVIGGGVILACIFAVLGNFLMINLAKPAKDLAKGNFNYNGKDEFGEIAEKMRQSHAKLEKLKEFAVKAAQNAARGDITDIPPHKELDGVFLEIVEIANVAIKSVGDDLRAATDMLTRMAEGDRPNLGMTAKFPISRPVDILVQTIASIQNDVGKLTLGMAGGNTQNLIPAERYKGCWATMAKNLNETVAVTNKQFTKATEALVELGKGNLQTQLDIEGQGYFAKFAAAFNAAANQLGRNVDTIAGALEDVAENRRVTGEFPQYFGKVRTAINDLERKGNYAAPPATAGGLTTRPVTASRNRPAEGHRQMSGAYKSPVTGNISRAKDYLKSDFGKY